MKSRRERKDAGQSTQQEQQYTSQEELREEQARATKAKNPDPYHAKPTASLRYAIARYSSDLSAQERSAAKRRVAEDVAQQSLGVANRRADKATVAQAWQLD